MDRSSREPDQDNNRRNIGPGADHVGRAGRQASRQAAQRATIARNLLPYTTHPEDALQGVVARGPAPTESHGTAGDTAQHSGPSHSSPYQAHRNVLDSPITQDFASRSSDRSADGGLRPVRTVRSFRLFDLLARDNRSDSRRRRNLTNNFDEGSEADERALPIRGAAPSIRSSSSSETVVVHRTEHADRTEAANGREHANAHEYASGSRPPTWTSAANETQRLPRLALTNRLTAQPGSTANRNNQRSLITASSSPALAIRVSTNDGGRQARVNSPTGIASRADSTTTVGSAFSTGGARASSRDAVANDSVPVNVAPPGTASTSHVTGDDHISDNAIIADGPLPAAGGAPTVGTMPAIGRDAYITVQSPDGRFYTVRIDLTDAAPNATYNITIIIPPVNMPQPDLRPTPP